MASFLSAQTGKRFGLRVAPQLNFASQVLNSQTRTGADIGQKAAPGIAFGLMYDDMLDETYGFHTGANLVFRNLRHMSRDSAGADMVRSTLTAIEIPLALKLRSRDLGGFRFRIPIGLVPGINLGHRETNLSQADRPYVRNPGLFNAFTLDVLAAPGVELNVGRLGTLDVGLSYHHGLLNINDKRDGFVDRIVRTSYFSLDAGLFF